ncbi:MAG: LPP20 family lipoprotein [Campylobacterota bacterium]|nr:LPP20 family lipoprotein [Campylobacterota bacterium]
MQFLNSKTLLLSATITLILSGCVSNMLPKKETNVQLPSWYINSPTNTTLFIYGEGEGGSIKEAKSNALDTMASRLVVSVSSSMTTTTNTSRSSTSGSSYSKDVSKSVKLDVEKIKFTNAKAKQSINIGDKFYVLMKVNREDLFDNKKKEFDINDKRIDTQYNSLADLAKLEQIHTLQDMYPKVINGKREAIVLNAIKNDFDQAPFLEKYDSYIDAIYDLKSSSIIVVQTNSKEKYFADQLIDQLNQEKFKISTNSDDGDIVIKINNKVKYSVARGWNIAKVSTTLSVVSKGKIVSNKIISTVGRSSTSKESALENGSLSFIKKIRKESLDKVIFSK